MQEKPPVIGESQDLESGEAQPPSQVGQRASEWWWLVSALASGLVIAAVVSVLLYRLARPLGLLVVAVAIAMALLPLIQRLERRIHHRTIAAVLVFLGVFLAIAGLGLVIAPALAEQARALFQRLPAYAGLLQDWLSRVNIIDAGPLASGLVSQIGSLSAALIALPLRIFSSILEVILVFFLALYWSILAPSMKSFFLSLFPQPRRAEISQVLHTIGGAMGGYVRGSVINGLIVGLLTFIGLLIIGVDTPLVLGIFAGILEFIPILGPFIAGVLIVLTALLQSPLLALLAAFYVLVMQQMESNILVPYIMRRQTELSPLLALLAVFFGGVAGGLVGVLAAVPAAAALQVILVSLAAPAARRLKEPR